MNSVARATVVDATQPGPGDQLVADEVHRPAEGRLPAGETGVMAVNRRPAAGIPVHSPATVPTSFSGTCKVAIVTEPARAADQAWVGAAEPRLVLDVDLPG